MEKISVYLNYQASHSTHDWEKDINRALFRSTITYHYPQSIDELRHLLSEDIAHNISAVISIGGDGTVNTLIQSLKNTGIGLLVIPGGTANDLAFELGNPQNIKKITQFIRNHETKEIDLISINGHCMATNGGLGLGGFVASQINTLRSRIPLFKQVMRFVGKKIYGLFLLKELLKPRFHLYRFKLSSQEFSGEIKTAALLINNQSVVGGVFKIAPQTNNADGKFNVTFLTHKGRIQFLQCAKRVMKGDYPKDDPSFVSFESSELKIELLEKKPKSFFGDGEVFESGHHWNVSIVPKALKVFARSGEKELEDLYHEVSLQ